MRAILEEDIAVKVREVGHRGPFIGAEGSELAGFVGFVREFNVFLPGRVRDLQQRLDFLSLDNQSAPVAENSSNFLPAVVLKY